MENAWNFTPFSPADLGYCDTKLKNPGMRKIRKIENYGPARIN